MKKILLAVATCALMVPLSMNAAVTNVHKQGIKSWNFGAPKTGNPSLDAWATGVARSKDSKKGGKGITPTTSLENVSETGLLTIDNGEEWFYTQSVQYDPENFNMILSSHIDVYNALAQPVGTIVFNTPQGMKINSVEVYHKVSTKFFDIDVNREIIIGVHGFDEEYNQFYKTFIYEIGSTEPEMVFDGFMAAFYSEIINDWTCLQRLVIETESVEISDGEPVYRTNLNIFKQAGWGTGPELMTTLSVDSNLLYYTEHAPYFSMYNLKDDGGLHYALCHYEVPYMTPESEQNYYEDPVPQENNNFIVELYDDSFNKVQEFKIPVEQIDGYLYTFYGLGRFSYDDITTGVYGEGLNFTITKCCYKAGSDEDRYFFEVYDVDGNLLKTIASDVIDWKMLYAVKNQPTQYTFIKEDADSQQYLEMVNIPSAEVAATFPLFVDGRQISFNFDRCSVDDGYKYVFSLATGELDAQGNVIATVAWYNPDTTVYRYVNLNQGPACEYYEAYIYGAYLSPFLFNTDDLHEYIGLAKITKPQGTGCDNILRVMNDDSEMVAEFKGDTEHGQYWNGGIYCDNLLFIYYFNQDNWEYSIDIFKLPLTSFTSGGDGTAANPYRVKTVGDLMMISERPNACYLMVNDLDMSLLPMSWTPIEGFSGSFDGGNNTISNLYIDNEDGNAALFASVSGSESSHASIKNLNIVDAEILCNENAEVAFLAGPVVFTELSNIKVSNSKISGNAAESNVGGIVSDISLMSAVTECSLVEVEIEAPGAASLGGITSVMRTGSKVRACSVEGSLTGHSQIGGVAGSLGARSDAELLIADCHVNALIEGHNTIGGVLGYGRIATKNCYVEGKIHATHASQWDGFSTGGIVGFLMRDWSYSADPKVIEDNVVALSEIKIDGEIDGTVHRISGNTIVNEADDDGAEFDPENAMANNYALASLAVVDSAIGGDDASSTEGKSIENITPEFLASLGFKEGFNAESPWTFAGASPMLYFENPLDVKVTADVQSLDLKEGDEAVVTFVVENYNVANLAVEFPIFLSVKSTQIVDGNALKVTVVPVANGEGELLAKTSSAMAVVNVKASGFSGVESVVGDNNNSPVISYDGTTVSAPDCEISVYSIAGNMVASGRGSVSVENLSKGVYVAIAVDADSHRATLKIAVK